jgi:hypothetical protein
MADYSKDAAEALAAIKEAGKEFEIFRPSPVFDDISGIPTDAATPKGKITAVVLPYSKNLASLDDSLKEALVKGKLRKLLAAAQGAPFVPQALDVVNINGTQWQVIGNTPLAPDGTTPIIFTMAIVEGAPFTPTPEDG